MSLADVGVELSLEHGQTAFAPGARVGGVASWVARGALTHLELELRWTAQGHGGRDLKIVETVRFDEPQAEERRPFIIALPVGPYSFRGALISLTWSFELTAFPGGETTRVDLTIGPDRRIVDLR